MSFLFKAVLGQGVVHPPPTGKTRDSDEAVNGVNDTDSEAAQKLKSTSASLNTKEFSEPPISRKSTTNGSAVFSLPTRPSENAATSLMAPTTTSPSPSPSSSPPPSTPTRTLLLRIEGCTVAQDIRDAQRDLLRCTDLPYALDTTSLKSLLGLLISYAEDESITEPTLHLLANVTDLDLYPDQLESNRRIIDFSAEFKRHAKEALLQPLVDAVPLLLEYMKPNAPFWSRYYVIVLLQRLVEYEPFKVNEALLAARGISALLDALNEVQHERQLLKQTLVLLTSLTLADAELQTLLAFDNAFDSLFDVIQREGGVRRGGTIAHECLTVMHNMLRSNKATQKLFCEMGCAARLASLFDTVPSELKACTAASLLPNGSARSSTSHTHRQPMPIAEKLEAFLDGMEKPDAFLGVLMSVSILACVLRSSDEGAQDRYALQESLLRCGLLSSLARLAFSGLAIDDATRIEAVRVLALLLRGSRRAVEEWLSLPPLMTLLRATLPYTVREWSAPRALVSYICETTDTTLVSAGVQLFTALLGVPSCEERVAEVFLGGLVSLGPGQDNSGKGDAASRASPTTSSSSTVKTIDHTSASKDEGCGAALARVLLSSTSSPVEKYFAAQVVRALVALPGARQVIQALVLAPVPPQLQSSTLDGLVKAQPGWTRSARIPPSFFNYFATFLLFCLSGGAAAQQVNTATLGAYVGTLQAWMGSCPIAASHFVEEATWGEALVHQTGRDGAAHLRLWTAVLIASACVMSSKGTGGSPAPSHSVIAATALAQRFIQVVGGCGVLDTIFFDAQASTPSWQNPVSNGLLTQSPTPYDAAFKATVEQLVLDFKHLLASVAPSSAMSSPSSTQMRVGYQGQRATGTGVTPPSASSPSLPSGSLAAMNPPSDRAAAPSETQKNSSASSANLRGESDFAQPVASPSRLEVASLQAELEVARAEKTNLMKAVDEWRERAEEMAARCASLEEEHRHAAAAAEEERVQVEKAVTSAAVAAHLQTASAGTVEGLRENIRLLEEALASKEEEHQQLVESLNLMEQQLRYASTVTAASACNQRQGPPPHIVEAMETERKALAEQLSASQEEKVHLEKALHGLGNDYNDLLLLVAELNEECLSVKASSSIAPTPIRLGPEDVGLDMRQETVVPQKSSCFVVAMSGKSLFAGTDPLPGASMVAVDVQDDNINDCAETGTRKVQEEEQQQQAFSTQAPSSVLVTEEQTKGCTESTSGALHCIYGEATCITIGLPDSKTPVHAPAAPPPGQQSTQIPAASGAADFTSNQSVSQTDAMLTTSCRSLLSNGPRQASAQQLPSHPSHQNEVPFLPPEHGAPPHDHGRRQSALHAPRYPDPFLLHPGEGVGGSAALLPPRDPIAYIEEKKQSLTQTPSSLPPKSTPQTATISLPQTAQPLPLAPPPRNQCTVAPKEPLAHSISSGVHTEKEPALSTKHDDPRELSLMDAGCVEEASSKEAASVAMQDTINCPGIFPSAPRNPTDVFLAPVTMVTDTTLVNPFLVGSGCPPENTLSMNRGCISIDRSGVALGVGEEGVRGRDGVDRSAGTLSAVTGIWEKAHNDAALNTTHLGAGNGFPLNTAAPQSCDTTGVIGGPTAPFNPFADLKDGAGEDSDDEFGNLH